MTKERPDEKRRVGPMMPTTRPSHHPKGITLVEVMMATLVGGVIMLGGYAMLLTGRSLWSAADTKAKIEHALQQGVGVLAMELKQSVPEEVVVLDGMGQSGSDVLRFAVPIVCQSGMSLLDDQGRVQAWGAPVRWGCRDLSCMDEDGSCAFKEYRTIEYRIDPFGRLVRNVLDENLSQRAQQIITDSLSDFQVSVTGRDATVSLTAVAKTEDGRSLSRTATVDVTLRNTQ